MAAMFFEGTRIGTLFRDTAATLVVSGPCYSACFFILVAGVNRVLADQPIGIHRPYYEKNYIVGLSHTDAEFKYREPAVDKGKSIITMVRLLLLLKRC